MTDYEAKAAEIAEERKTKTKIVALRKARHRNNDAQGLVRECNLTYEDHLLKNKQKK